MSMYKIDKGIPCPPPREATKPTTTGAIRELARAGIGDSILINAKPASVGKIAGDIGGKGWVTVRTDERGTRVWKTKEPSEPTKGF